MVFLLRPEDVPKDLTCAICMSVPLKPCSLRPCDHVYCEDCIRESLSHQQICPVDRSRCTLTDVRPFQEGTLAYRIWSGILIKCDNCELGCGWTGSISDYFNHKNNCKIQSRGRGRSDSDQELIDFLQFEMEDLTRKLQASRSEISRLKSAGKELEVRHNRLTRRVEIAAPNGTGGYAYDRFSVVKLTKLICQDLESKPHEIKANKIFECVRNIYTALKNDYADNPEH